ncbi:MAG: oxidoreductase, partial [Bacteroidetes bacterium]|nr:oxidoreductase [Bacteroidota bacterium]
MHTNLSEGQLDVFARDGYLLIDNFLEEDIALQLLEELKHWKEQEAFRIAGIGKLTQHKIEEDFRKDEIKWIDRENCLPATKVYLQSLESLMKQLSREFYLSLKDFES